MARRLKFPDPSAFEAGDNFVICPHRRVLRLYQEGSDPTAANLSASCRAWFEAEAINKGWSRVDWAPQDGQNNPECAVLYR